MQNLHSCHPWQSDSAVEPTWMCSRRPVKRVAEPPQCLKLVEVNLCIFLTYCGGRARHPQLLESNSLTVPVWRVTEPATNLIAPRSHFSRNPYTLLFLINLTTINSMRVLLFQVRSRGVDTDTKRHILGYPCTAMKL